MYSFLNVIVSQGSGKEERVRSRYREEYERNKKLLVG